MSSRKTAARGRAGAAIALTLLLAGGAGAHAATQTVTEAVLHADEPGAQVNRQIFGQFAEHLGHGIYGGVWVGPDSPIPNEGGYRTDVLQALKDIHVPVVRWPGGCFADEYHWRDGVGPADKRPVKVNTNWGGVTEPNSFGTHEYMGLMERLGAESYVAGNVGNAPPREMAEWVEYMTSPTGSTLAQERAANGHPAPFKLSYFGIGNELWGCGGNMRPEYAADVTRRYATFLKPGSGKLMKLASGPNSEDYRWTEVMMREAGSMIDGIALHYYTVPGTWENKNSATRFTAADWAETMSKALHMDELVTRHSAVMDVFDPQKRVWLIVDEWGNWFQVEPGTNPGFLYQQNTLRDAVTAAINLNIFTRHADRVKMTSIAQMVNVLQSVLLTDGPRMVKTPTYWVFDMYQPWQDATALPLELKSPTYADGKFSMPAVTASAVRGQDGRVHIALANLDPENAAPVHARLAGVTARTAAGRILTAPQMNAMNTFDRPDTLRPTAFNGAKITGDGLTLTLPAKSVVVLELR